MPRPELSRQELRLGSFGRLFAAVYFAGAAVFAAFPGVTYRLAAFGAEPSAAPDALFWNVLAVSMMTALATACLVVASRPRERRHALLPVVVAKLTSSGLALAHAGGAGSSAALWAVLAADLPICLLTLFVYRSAAPGIRGEVTTERAPDPPVEEAPPQIQLKVGKR